MRTLKKTIILGGMICAFSFVATGCGNNQNDKVTDAQVETTETTTEEATEGTTETITEEVTEGTTETIIEEVTSVDLFKDSGLSTFELSSEDLQEGEWNPVISNLDDGLNVSPQLSWEIVPEANSYVVYMVDSSAGYWLHWKSKNVTETNLPRGWASEEEYIGPYPPSGTHSYDIYVFALKQPVERVKGTFNYSNAIFYDNAMELDTADDGTTGNIISYGYLPGTYTRED